VGLNKVGYSLKDQGNLNGAVTACRESLDIMRELTAKAPNNALWQMDTVIPLGCLKQAGDDPRGQLNEQLAILNRLKAQGQLPSSQQGLIGIVEAELAKYGQPDRALAAPPEIQGTYIGTNTPSTVGTTTVSQVPGEDQISLTFQQSGSNVTATYLTGQGARGRGTGRISGNVVSARLQSETVNCPGSFTASLRFSLDLYWPRLRWPCAGLRRGKEDEALARIMHHVTRFCTSVEWARASGPSGGPV
jgi:hypothetical protein